ncbi:zeta toxin family protein [Streptomyces sp. NPDC059533]|uniref:zeta toxin family protein n=1 Tax=unclassified Streptomyces TaxID=2593676 RepID=UPI00367A9C69
MIDPAEVERYRLAEAENRRIFRERIVPDLLEGRATQETPTVIVLIGQPGAGKSRLTHMIATALNRHGGFVDVDSDLYKPYHPAYDELMARDDTLMAAYTRADGRAWMAQAEEYVRSHGLHAIIQETSQNAPAVADKMRAYRESGARLEALFMGVSKAESDQGIANRYFEQLADRGQGRLTVQANANESFHGILDLADLIDRGRLVHLAGVYRRGESKPRHTNSSDDNGERGAPPRLRDGVEVERARPLSAAESSGFADTQLRLRAAGMRLGGEWPDRLARIEQSTIPILKPVDVQRLGLPVRPSAASARAHSTAAAPMPDQPGRGPVQGTDSKARPPQRRTDGPDASRGRSQ